MSYADDPVSYSSANGVTLATFGSGQVFAYLQTASFPAGQWVLQAPAQQTTSAAVSASTGVNPVEVQYSLYGHTIPLSVLGKGRIGCEIVAGPWVVNGMASFIVSAGVPADPSGTRTLKEVAFDSEVVWTGSQAGDGTLSSAGFHSEVITCRFYNGSLTQSADPLETSNFGSSAVAYRPQILLAVQNLPLANTKFRKIPYVALLMTDGSGEGVNIGEAFERLAYSPWVGYTSAQFETSGITDALPEGGLIITSDVDFLSLVQQFARFYPTWDILQTDKLRIVDNSGAVDADISLDGSRLVGNVTVSRRGPDSVPAIIELSTIDPDADYTIIPFRAQSPHDPVAVTTSEKTDQAYLPAIMNASTRASVATLAQYHERQAVKTISGTAMAYGLEIEPGSQVAIVGLDDDFHNEVFKVKETLHGVNNSVEFTAEAILRCTITIGVDDPPPAVSPITGAVGWWDASVSSSLTLSGSNIVGVADQSGNGSDLVVRSGSSSPTFNAIGLNSLPAMVFVRTSAQALICNSLPLGTGNTLTFWAVCTFTNDTDVNGRIISYTAIGATHDYDNAASFDCERKGLNAPLQMVRNNVNMGFASDFPVNTPTRLIGTIDSSGVMRYYVDGVLFQTSSASPGNWTTGGALGVGAGKLDNQYWDGMISEIGISNVFSDSTAVTTLDTYLKTKWGL